MNLRQQAICRVTAFFTEYFLNLLAGTIVVLKKEKITRFTLSPYPTFITINWINHNPCWISKPQARKKNNPKCFG